MRELVTVKANDVRRELQEDTLLEIHIGDRKRKRKAVQPKQRKGMQQKLQKAKQMKAKDNSGAPDELEPIPDLAGPCGGGMDEVFADCDDGFGPFCVTCLANDWCDPCDVGNIENDNLIKCDGVRVWCPPEKECSEDPCGLDIFAGACQFCVKQ